VNLPEQPPTFRPPTAAERPWWWRLEDASGTFSPTLRKGIGMALVPSFVNAEAELGVDVRGRREIFRSTKLPFVDPSVRES